MLSLRRLVSWEGQRLVFAEQNIFAEAPFGELVSEASVPPLSCLAAGFEEIGGFYSPFLCK